MIRTLLWCFSIVMVNNIYAQVGFEKISTQKFDWAGDCEDGLCLVQVNGKWGYCDISGRMAIPAEFTRAYKFANGYAQVIAEGNTILINKKGVTKPSEKYGAVSPYGDELFTYTGSDKLVGFLDKNYQEKGALKCKAVLQNIATEGMVQAINDKGMYGYLNYNADLVIPASS